SSSSDGDNAGEVKNVARLVMRPPGHSGKAKKGHLVFDASFEGGNLGRVDYVGELDYDLYVRPDIANLRHRVWFNFTVENVRADQSLIPILPFTKRGTLTSSNYELRNMKITEN
ncbi:hypothetical protein TNIN_314631, partial [Trichonephila inaurata madagascariensis]